MLIFWFAAGFFKDEGFFEYEKQILENDNKKNK